MADGRFVQGRQVVGLFQGVDTARRKATDAQVADGKPGTPVQGMYLLKLVEQIEDRERPHDLTFFETDQEGEVTKISKTIAEGVAKVGDLVSVRFKSQVSKSKYVSDTAVSMVVLAPAAKLA